MERTISFAEIRARVRAVAKGLLARGCGPGDILTVFAPNCLDRVCVVHAAMLIGVTVAPVNPTYQTREQMHHLAESTDGQQRPRAILWCHWRRSRTLPRKPPSSKARRTVCRRWTSSAWWAAMWTGSPAKVRPSQQAMWMPQGRPSILSTLRRCYRAAAAPQDRRTVWS